MNPITLTRFMNLFGGQPQQQAQSSPLLNQAPAPYNPYDDITQQYKPRTEISTQYSDALAHMPTNQKPGALRAIGSALVAGILGRNDPAQGIAVGTDLINAPNNNRLFEWKNKVDALRMGANEEDRYNSNQRQLVLDTVGKKQAQAKIDETARENRVNEKIRQQRADAYSFKSSHPNWQAQTLADGSLMYVNPQNPAEQMKFDVKVNEMTLSDREALLNLQHENRSKEIDQRGDIESGLVRERGNEARETAHTRGEESRETRSTPTASQATDSVTTVEQKDAKGNVVGKRTTSTTRINPALRQKAIEFLRSINKNASEENIEHAIKTGRVK